jgi:hypothetical protein
LYLITTTDPFKSALAAGSSVHNSTEIMATQSRQTLHRSSTNSFLDQAAAVEEGQMAQDSPRFDPNRHITFEAIPALLP